jgi:hypothetical protein
MPDDGTDLVQLDSIPNWSPITDCILVGKLFDHNYDVVSRSVDPLVQGFPLEGRDRLYVSAGHRAEGSLKELRTGLKTNITVEFELEQYLSSFFLVGNIVSIAYGVYRRMETIQIRWDTLLLQ